MDLPNRRRLVLMAVTMVLALAGTTAVAAAGATGAYGRPGLNERVSVASNGAQATRGAVGCNLTGSDVSADGRYVAFQSVADNLVPGDLNKSCDVFVRDRHRGTTEIMSVASDGSKSVPSLGAGNPSISADGRYIAFHSYATNLVPGDTNNIIDIFVRDRITGTTKRVSVSSGGEQATGVNPLGDGSIWPSISANGRYVSFTSSAANLVKRDSNGVWDIFVYDRKLHRTKRVSIASNGAQANSMSWQSSINGNGRYVVFDSRASNLVSGKDACGSSLLGAIIQSACGAMSVFVRDTKLGKTREVAVPADGSPPRWGVVEGCATRINGIELLGQRLLPGVTIPWCGSRLTSWWSREIDASGRYVTFVSDITNLVPNDTNLSPSPPYGVDYFVHDLKANRTERVSVDSYGRELDDVYSSGDSLSGNGRYVSYSRSRIGSACNGVLDILGQGDRVPGELRRFMDRECVHSESYVYDRIAGSLERVSLSRSGGEVKYGDCGNGESSGSFAGPLSYDGRYLSVFSSGHNLVSGDTNNLCDYFVRDRGRAVGVGGFGGTGSTPARGPDPDCLADVVCLPPLDVLASRDSTGDVSTPGADLIGARVVPRPALRDLFVRMDLARMPSVAGAPAGGLMYGLRFTAGGQRYEVRVQRVPGADFDPKGGASFGLFRQDGVTGLFTKVASLKGGYGTTGASVVFAVPLKELGVVDGARLTGVGAFTGVGSYLSGVTKVLDSVRLVR